MSDCQGEEQAVELGKSGARGYMQHQHHHQRLATLVLEPRNEFPTSTVRLSCVFMCREQGGLRTVNPVSRAGGRVEKRRRVRVRSVWGENRSIVRSKKCSLRVATIRLQEGESFSLANERETRHMDCCVPILVPRTPLITYRQGERE